MQTRTSSIYQAYPCSVSAMQLQSVKRYFRCISMDRACGSVRQEVYGLALVVWHEWLAFALGKVSAQHPSAELSRMFIEDLMDVPIGSVSKFEQRLVDASACVSIVTSENIVRYGYRTLVESCVACVVSTFVMTAVTPIGACAATAKFSKMGTALG